MAHGSWPWPSSSLARPWNGQWGCDRAQSGAGGMDARNSMGGPANCKTVDLTQHREMKNAELSSQREREHVSLQKKKEHYPKHPFLQSRVIPTVRTHASTRNDVSVWPPTTHLQLPITNNLKIRDPLVRTKSKWNGSVTQLNVKWNRSQTGGKSNWTVVASIRHRSWVRMGLEVIRTLNSKWSLYGIGVASKLHLWDIEVKPKWLEEQWKGNTMNPKWKRSEVEVTSNRNRNQSEVRSKYNHNGINVKLKWARHEFKAISKCNRCAIEVKPK